MHAIVAAALLVVALRRKHATHRVGVMVVCRARRRRARAAVVSRSDVGIAIHSTGRAMSGIERRWLRPLALMRLDSIGRVAVGHAGRAASMAALGTVVTAGGVHAVGRISTGGACTATVVHALWRTPGAGAGWASRWLRAVRALLMAVVTCYRVKAGMRQARRGPIL